MLCKPRRPPPPFSLPLRLRDAQVIAVIPRLRPTLTSKYRRAWNQWHWWQGRAATVLSVANIF